MGKPIQPVVISGLVKRRRDLHAKADYLAKQLVVLRADIITLDNAIKVIDPDFDLKEIKPKRYHPPDTFEPFQQSVMTALRNSSDYLAVAEVCDQLTDYGYQSLSKGDKKKLRDRLKAFLYRQTRRGWVEKRDAKFKLVIAEFFEKI